MEIKATIIADSISEDDIRITTYELEYPRFIHAELMTHRLFSRNAASSRAIPIEKMMEQVVNNPAMPVQWGLNQAGMQAKGVHNDTLTCEWAWKKAAASAVNEAQKLQALGLHKQIVNRVLEPFQMMKTIVTATEFNNFFWLRCHTDAQPEIHMLADLMYGKYVINKPQLLVSGQWHLPYVSFDSGTYYLEDTKEILTLEEAQKVSASCCAQVSYRKLDDSLDKAIKIYDQLVSMSPVHASPFEHQATPMEYPNELDGYSVANYIGGCMKGATHTDINGSNWSGNLKGWIQYRQLIDNNTCWNYEGDQ